jgi:hypothetical protein
MLRLRRLVIALAGLALLASTVGQSVHAVAFGGPAAVGAACAALSDFGCDPGDDGGDRQSRGMTPCKAICGPMPMVLPPAAATIPRMPSEAVTLPAVVSFLAGQTGPPDPPPPRPTLID